MKDIPNTLRIDFDDDSNRLVLLDETGRPLMYLDDDFTETVAALLVE